MKVAIYGQYYQNSTEPFKGHLLFLIQRILKWLLKLTFENVIWKTTDQKEYKTVYFSQGTGQKF
jgi:hypothetical protein